jgi:hypothetical protein
MANTKISQLPSYTGTAADVRWFVMNNSGETETYKYSGYTSPFRKADGFNSIISAYYDPNVVPNKLDMILGGTGNTMAATSSYTDGLGNSIVGGANNVMDLNSPAGGQHYGHSIFGGNNNTLRWRANASVNTIVGGQGNLMDCYYGGNTIIGGSSNTSQGSANNTIIGAQSSTITGGDRNGIWGGYSQSVGGPSDNNIYGGFDNTITDGSYNSIVGGSTNGITSGSYHFIGGGQNNTITGGTNVVMIGCSGRTATDDNTTYTENIKGFGYYYNYGGNNTIGGTDTYQFIFGKNNTSNYTAGILNTGSFIFGENNIGGGRMSTAWGFSNSVTGWDTHAFGDNIGMSGQYSMGGGQNSSSNSTYTFMWGSGNNLSNGTWQYSFGENNDIDVSSYSGIFGGLGNRISGTGDRNVIIGSSASTISNKTDVVMLGTSGRTADYDHTTFVENIHAYRTPSTQVQPVFSGTVFTCNLDLGAKSQFYITGTSTINITNVRDGASFMIKTQTDGNYVMTWTATGGYTFLFEGGTKDPGNNVIDIFQFEVFGNVIYGSRKHNFS